MNITTDPENKTITVKVPIKVWKEFSHNCRICGLVKNQFLVHEISKLPTWPVDLLRDFNDIPMCGFDLTIPKNDYEYWDSTSIMLPWNLIQKLANVAGKLNIHRDTLIYFIMVKSYDLLCKIADLLGLPHMRLNDQFGFSTYYDQKKMKNQSKQLHFNLKGK